MDKYQNDYSQSRPQMYHEKSRKIKAMRIIKLLQNYYGIIKLKELILLDIGSSTGIIDNYLAKYFNKVIGIDIDKQAINFAHSKFKRENLQFKLDNAMELSFPNNSFDIVVCTQIYEHVPDPKRLMSEIYRVLKPNGVCYFAALNKLWPWEPHYNLLFLGWLPKKIANYYINIFRKKKNYYETLKNYWELKRLVKEFTVKEYTSVILKSPKTFGYSKIEKFPINIIMWIISPLSKYFSPTFFWLLIKR